MPDPTLQTTALRYAAGDLTPAEAGAFEVRLADDQDARDALSEAVRLSAAALGQSPPTPHRSFRAAIRERLHGWCPGWLARRAYRGHPLAWAGLGAALVATAAAVGVSIADREPSPVAPGAASPTPVPVAVAPPPRPVAPETLVAISTPRAPEVAPPDADESLRAVAELWADLSTPDGVGKAHEDEMKWRQKLRDAGTLLPGRTPGAGPGDAREP